MEDQLDALNASRRVRGNAPELIRRTMEAQLENKAKRRRSRETAASSNWKRG